MYRSLPWEKSAHIYPLKYAKGIITKTHREGQEFEVLIEITSNHMGTIFFCFKISELGAAPIPKEKLVYQLKEPDGSDSWELPKDTKILEARSTAVWFNEILQVS